ncbi:MAG: AAA family ATPase [Gemmatimonadota bacterium]|nr:AAA family ATPase [Gemmatimonadota bacterium]
MTMAGTPSEVRVKLFGAARAEVAGMAVPLTPLQLGLVTLVFGHGPDGLSRPAAVRLLWNEEAGGRGRQRIRQLLLDIRTRAGRRLIETPGDFLRPQDHVACDLQAFEAAVLEGRMHEAAMLIRLGFIVTTQPSAEAYDDWRSARRARLLREVRTRAFTRWSRAFERGNWMECLDAAEALYTLDPDDPAAVGRVIEVRALAGQLDAAEAAFDTYVGSLPPGSDPTSGLVETIERVRSARQAAVSERDGATHLPLVGRRPVLRAARDALEAVVLGKFELLLISGESGIGKTRVLDEIHTEARLRDFQCLRARAVELERSIPLNPLLDALSGIDLEPYLTELGQPWSSVVASLLPAGALEHPREEPPPIQPSSLSRRLLDSFSLLFQRLAAGQPTVLFIDDLQWADATTVATLQFMQRRWTGGPLGVFGTVRPELVRPEDAVARYLNTTAGLQVRRIELGALSIGEAVELVDVIAAGEIDEERSQRLSSIAGRHPLYLTELTRDFMAGRLKLPERPVDHVSIPTSLGQMLDDRLEAMDDRAMRVAGLLAVAAKPLRITDAAALSGLSLDAATSAVDSLVRARFVVVERTQVGVAHELFRSAIYRHLTEPRRALHHRAIAQHLLATSREETAGEVAAHFAQAGEPELAAEHGWSAARRALAAGALAEAIQFFDVVAESEPDPIKRADATAELARALHLSRDITAANPKLSLAADRLRATGRPHLARRMAIKRVEGLAEVDSAPVKELLSQLEPIKAAAHEAEDWETVALALDAELHLLHRSGEVDGIRSILDEMRSLANKESVEARLLARTGLALGVFFDDPVEALQAAKEAVELADEGKGYRLRALVRLMVVLQAGGLLTQPDAAAIVEEARTLARRSGDVLLQFSIESNLAVAFLDAGDSERAEVLMTHARGIAGSGEMDINRFIEANNEAELSLSRRDYEAAAQAFSKASSYLGLTTPSYMLDVVNAGLGFCALETGDLEEARRRSRHLQAPPDNWYFDPTTIVAFRARILERQGRYTEAIQLLEDTAANLEDRLVLSWLKVVILQVRLMSKHAPSGAKDLAETAAARAQALGLEHREKELRALSLRLTCR